MVGFWRRWFMGGKGEKPPRHAVVMPAATVAENEKDVTPGLSSADVQDRFFRFVLDMADAEATELSLAENALLGRLDKSCGGDRFDITSLPRLPEVLPRLLRLLKSDDVDGTKINRLISRDPGLVGEVMRVSQSALYRTVQPINSLRQAVVMIGHDGLRQIVALHVMKPILQSGAGMLGYNVGQRLGNHAERCAHASAHLAKGHRDSFEAYLAGLVCNAGVGALLRVLIMEAPTQAVLSRTFLAHLVTMANHLSIRAAQHWELPSNVVEALHDRFEAHQRGAVTELGNALLAADHLAMIQVLAENGIIDSITPPSSVRVDGLSDSLMARAQQDLRRVFQHAKDNSARQQSFARSC